jgi:hypothetical protein
VRAAGCENYRLGERIAQQRKEPGAPLRGRGTPAYPARLRSERARNFLEKLKAAAKKNKSENFNAARHGKLAAENFPAYC